MSDLDDHLWKGATFEFEPTIPHGALVKVCEFSQSLGYTLYQRPADFTLEEVQEELRDHGPSSFLRRFRIQEDISPKAPPRTTEQFIIERLSRLVPTNELLIIDPYMFSSAVRDENLTNYAELVARVVDAGLGSASLVRFVANDARSGIRVRDAAEKALRALRPDLTIEVFNSNDFHDRFWIADRARGAVVGTSFNGLGSKIFLMDELARGDVETLVQEVTDLGVVPAL